MGDVGEHGRMILKCIFENYEVEGVDCMELVQNMIQRLAFAVIVTLGIFINGKVLIISVNVKFSGEDPE